MKKLHSMAMRLAISAFVATAATNAVAYSIDKTAYLQGATWDYTLNKYDDPEMDYAYIRKVSTDIAGDVVIPSHLEGCKVQNIGDNAFYNCTNMTSIALPSSLKSCGIRAFYNCTNLVAVHISDLSSWCRMGFYYGSYYEYTSSNPLCMAQNLYLNGELLTDLVVPGDVTSMNASFYGYTNLVSVVLPDSCKSIAERAFACCSNLKRVDTGNGLEYISISAFMACTALEDLTIGSNVASISPGSWNWGDGAFYGCTGLKNVTIPGNVRAISRNSFCGCHNLTNVTMCAGLETINNGAFYSTALANVEIPDTVTYIGVQAFYNSLIESAKIPHSVKHIGLLAFGGCNNLKRVFIDDLASWCEIEFPILDGNREDPKNAGNPLQNGAELYVAGVPVGNTLHLPNDVTNISQCAFYGWTNIVSVTMADSVKNIGKWAFSKCTELKSVVIDDGVLDINGGAFQGCKCLSSVNIGASVTNIGYGAFENCSALNSIVIPNCVRKMEDYAFSTCSSMKSLSLGNGLKEIGPGAFNSCKSLTGVAIPDSVTNICGGAFAYCSGLKKVNIGKNVETIGREAFWFCQDLTKVVFSGTAPSVEEYAFYYVNADCTAYVPWMSAGWGVAIPGTWNGINIAYMFTENSEVAEEELPETVALLPGAEVKVAVNHEMLVEQLKVLAAKALAMPREGIQDANYFRVTGDYDAAKGIVTLKAVIDEEKIGLNETLAEVAGEDSLSTFQSDGTMSLTNVKEGFYYGLAAAGRLDDLDDAVEAVKADGLTQAVDGEVRLSAERPTGGAAFFKVVVSDSER